MLTIYGLADSCFPNDLRYIGRTYSKINRSRFHKSVFLSDDWDSQAWTPLSLWKRAMRLAGRAVVVRDLVIRGDERPALAIMIPPEVHDLEKSLIREAAASVPLLNKECCYQAFIDSGIGLRAYEEYRRSVLRAICGDPAALDTAMNYESQLPKLCSILSPGCLHEEISRAQKPSRYSSRQSPNRFANARTA